MATRSGWLFLIGAVLLGPGTLAAQEYRPLAVLPDHRAQLTEAPHDLPGVHWSTPPQAGPALGVGSERSDLGDLTRPSVIPSSGAPPAVVRAQNYEVPPVPFTGPLSHPRYEEGGFFMGLQFLYYRQTRPIRNQDIAYRGLVDVDGSINGTPGAFIGSGDLALTTHQLQGPGTWQPGFNLTLGWRFESGTVLQVSWYHLWDSRYSATAGLLPPNGNVGQNLENTFLTAFVYNFPVDYGGNPQNTFAGNPGATFGIWNAASLMTIDFIQRFDMFDLTARMPMWQSDKYRMYGLVGPRIVWLWERFRWRTVDTDVQGLATADTTAIYSNVTSNRLYGVHFGAGNEWFLGDTPAGAFSVSLDCQAALYIDFVKGRAKYELADRSTAATRARNLWSLVPGVEARASLWWYPWEAIQVQVGYDLFAFFNTVASPRPVDFNYGALDPAWDHGVFRFLHGLTLGVGFVF